MRKLGFDIPGVKGEVANDIAVVTSGFSDAMRRFRKDAGL